MARTRGALSCDATRDVNPDAADAPDAPPAAGEDNKSNPPNQEEDDEACALDNINALIRRDMIAMYAHVLGFKEGTATALYNNRLSP